MPLKRVLPCLLVAFATMWPAGAAYGDGSPAAVFAGTGEPGYAGDGGPAVEARLDGPAGIAVAEDGTVYVADSGNHVVRAIAPDGLISTVAGSGEAGDAGTAITAGTPAADVALSVPGRLALGPDGSLYLADDGLKRVLAIAADGTVSVIAGDGRTGYAGDGGPAAEATFGRLGGLAVAPDGTVYIGDIGNRRIRAVSPSGSIDTIAGDGSETVTAAGGDALSSAVPYAAGLAVGEDGALWIADGGGLLRRYADGRIATVTVPADGSWAMSTEPSWPPADPVLNDVTAVAVGADGTVFAVNARRESVLALTGDGVLGAAAEAGRPLSGPAAVAGEDRVYIADLGSNRVFSAVLTVPSGGGDTSPGWLPYTLAGAAVVVVAAVATVAVRRRRRG